MSILTSGPETWPWGPGGQTWSQTATDGAWFSTTALLSGRDRPRYLCVLRLSCSEPETRRTGSVATSLLSNSLLVARAGNVELDRYPQLMLLGRNPLICPTSNRTYKRCLRCFMAEVCRWITSLASGSSCWVPNEVVVRGPRHTPPPPPQIALK